MRDAGAVRFQVCFEKRREVRRERPFRDPAREFAIGIAREPGEIGNRVGRIAVEAHDFERARVEPAAVAHVAHEIDRAIRHDPVEFALVGAGLSVDLDRKAGHHDPVELRVGVRVLGDLCEHFFMAVAVIAARFSP